MLTTIPKKALVALADFSRGAAAADLRRFVIAPPDQALVPAFDRSFHFGDSLYEVTRSYEGVLFSLDEHLERLKHSAELAMFEIMPNLELGRQMIREACRAYFRQ